MPINNPRQRALLGTRLYDNLRNRSYDNLSRNILRHILNSSKLYIDNNIKYSGEEYDILHIKLDIFYNLYKTLGIPEECYTNVFKAMLRKQAQEFYYNKLVKRGYNIYIIIKIL